MGQETGSLSTIIDQITLMELVVMANSGEPIVLYINSRNCDKWSSWEAKSLKVHGGCAVTLVGLGGGIDSGVLVRVEGLKAAAGQIGKLPEIAKQGAIQAGGQFAGTTANQIMSLSRGKVFNPNIELLYEGPNVRSFPFTFSFIPKSPAEAATVASIILQFKKLSAPTEVGSMYEFLRSGKFLILALGDSC